MIGVAGLKMAEFAPATRERLTACLPPYAPMDNPVDTTAAILADMSMADGTLQAIVDDPNVGLVIYPFPMDYGEATTKLAESAIRVQARTDKPILPVWVSDRMGGGQRAFAEAGIMPARSIGKAVKAMQAWVDYGRWRANADMQWAPLLMQMRDAPPSSATEVLSEVQGKAWLARHGIVLLSSELARTPEQACTAAQSLGYPIVAKVVSAQVVHKSDAGGVRVNITNADELVQAWHGIHASVRKAHPDAEIDGLLIEKMAPADGVEVMIGVHRDPVFGHVLTFGLGGIYVEIFREVTHRLLPIGPSEAAEMVREVRFFPLLDGARGRPPCDVEALEKLLVKVSGFVAQHADNLVEMDLNPVWVGPRGQGAVPLDAVIVRYAGGNAER
jgi:acyl-CoA synthetase (NDP forming)